ncbi:histidine phosphatase family protein [Defluviitalea phaphyphila]|uniref:histidine phosphatase family protein n=1 Tax=Defluviitalea phaphyphila TaxID=1473580 RepID=UPI0007307601|nr:histidine phosphatase family protein [Defluviitalea phaphyphila]
MIKLYLIRHGETEWNLKHKYQGSTDVPLNDIGKKQALAIANRMEKYEIDAIYSSDLSRAYETANCIGNIKKLKVKVLPQLREINFGEWEGYTSSELKKIYGEEYKKFLLEPHKYTFPGEGSLKAVQMRLKEAIKIITSEHSSGNFIIVSHGAALKILIMTLLNIDLSLYRKFWLGNVSLSIIEKKDNDDWILSLLNDTSHLY